MRAAAGLNLLAQSRNRVGFEEARVIPRVAAHMLELGLGQERRAQERNLISLKINTLHKRLAPRRVTGGWVIPQTRARRLYILMVTGWFRDSDVAKEKGSMLE